MSRRSYLITLLIAALSVGAAVAQSTDAQKEKEKAEKAEKAEKDKLKAKEKAEGRAFAVAAPEAFAFEMGGGERSYLGVFLEEVTADRMKDLNLSEERGAVVMKVSDGSPAQKAGIKENDVIISFNGRRVDTVRELQRLLGETPPGRTVVFEVLRGGAQQTLTATVIRRTPEAIGFGPRMQFDDKYFKRREAEMREAEKALKLTEEQRKKLEEEMQRGFGHGFGQGQGFGNFNFVYPGLGGRFRGTRLGITAEPLTAQLAEFFGVKSGRGVLVTEVQSDRAAAKAGLKAGDVITAVDGKPVEGISGLATAFAGKEGPVVLTIVRNQSEQTLTINVEKPEPRPAVRRRANL